MGRTAVAVLCVGSQQLGMPAGGQHCSALLITIFHMSVIIEGVNVVLSHGNVWNEGDVIRKIPSASLDSVFREKAP